MVDVVIFLQNAWSPMYAGEEWPRDLWLPALQRSHSGKRLRTLEVNLPGVSLWYDNTTPIVGAEPDSVVPPDFDHMRRVIEQEQPRVIVACGKQAQSALGTLVVRVPVTKLPHPAWRFLDARVYENGAREIRQFLNGAVCTEGGSDRG